MPYKCGYCGSDIDLDGDVLDKPWCGKPYAVTTHDPETPDRKLLRDLWVLFTSTPDEIARQFGEGRCRSDHERINYALELMDGRLHPRR